MSINDPKSVDYKFSEKPSGLAGLARTLVTFLLGVIVASGTSLILYRQEQSKANNSDVLLLEKDLRAEQEKTAALAKKLNDAQIALYSEKEARALSDARVAKLEQQLSPIQTRTAMSISDIQVDLKRLGFYNGKADGVMGQRTRIALKAFQQASNLPATGSLDGLTVEALARAGTVSAPKVK